MAPVELYALIFATNTIIPKRILAILPKATFELGFHCFRRFRESVLQKSEARALLVDYWMGHENREMGTRYAKQLLEDVAWRKQWAKKVGLGFKLTDLQLEIGQPGQLSVTKTQPAKAA